MPAHNLSKSKKKSLSISLALAVSVTGFTSTYESAMASTLRGSSLVQGLHDATYSPASGLPNSKLTPGAVDPAVTQNNISSTICVVGYTKTVRPPVSYTTPLKKKQLTSGYNLNGDLSTQNYEEDHLIPLAVGGSPSDVKNLWPEPRKVAWGASKKDQLENKLHLLVCSHKVALKVAQQAFAINWIASYKKYVLGQ